MKKESKKTNSKNAIKRVKILTICLLVVLISMIGFFGIYAQNRNQMSNKVKDYSYSMALKGTRTIILQVSAGTTEVVKDSEGNVIENATEDEIKEKGYITEEVPNNKEEDKTVENYKKSKRVIEKRLDYLGVQEYNVSLNEETGEITVEIPEDSRTDVIVSKLNVMGKFEIIDAETKEVLLDNSNIKSSDVLYNRTETGTRVFLEIAFDKEGKKKLRDISKTYVKTEVENNSVENNVEANSTTENEVVENNTTTENTAEENKQTIEKKVTMKIDGQEIMSTSFDEEMKEGKIQLAVGKIATDTSALQEYVTEAQNVAVSLNDGNLPLKYNILKNPYILSDITEYNLIIVEIVIAVAMLVGIIILIAKYKLNGLLASVAYIGLVAIYTLLIRYTNVIISIESIFVIEIMLVLNYIFTFRLLKNIENKDNSVNKATIETYKKFFNMVLPIFILSIVFCFVRWITISSFGMILFWGLVIIAIYNAIITRSLLKINLEEK